jgi:hypothetical protein
LLAVGRPVIVAAEAVSEAALMLNEEDIGWVARSARSRRRIRSAASDRDKTSAKVVVLLSPQNAIRTIVRLLHIDNT